VAIVKSPAKGGELSLMYLPCAQGVGHMYEVFPLYRIQVRLFMPALDSGRAFGSREPILTHCDKAAPRL